MSIAVGFGIINMKKIFQILCITAICSFAHADEIITKSDLSFIGDRIGPNQATLSKQMKDGENKVVNVKIDFTFKFGSDAVLRNITVESINKMIDSTVSAAKSTLKNKYSFVPREIQIVEMKEPKVAVALEYTAKNSYGADVVNKKIITFTPQGDLLMDVY